MMFFVLVLGLGAAYIQKLYKVASIWNEFNDMIDVRKFFMFLLNTIRISTPKFL